MASILIDLKTIQSDARSWDAFWQHPLVRFLIVDFGAAACGVAGRVIPDPAPPLSAEILQFPVKSARHAVNE